MSNLINLPDQRSLSANPVGCVPIISSDAPLPSVSNALCVEPIDGKSGFIQVISPIPNSYPGISLLTDDIGEILGRDNCPCGRKGTYFIFKKRSEMADPKGCGDTLDI